MGYQHGKTLQPSLPVEQARRRNAELRVELSRLTAENNALEAQVATARLRVSEARRLLTRKVRDLEAARAQVERLSAIRPASGLPEPVFGGREGLLAAAEEILAHESRGSLAPRPLRGPSHGTERVYATGCRCGKCLAWRERRTAQAKKLRAA
jgi:chromosome segregation ATPase